MSTKNGKVSEGGDLDTEKILIKTGKTPLNIILPPRVGLKLEPNAPLETVIAVINLMGLNIQGDACVKTAEGLPGVILTHKD